MGWATPAEGPWPGPLDPWVGGPVTEIRDTRSPAVLFAARGLSGAGIE